MDRGRWNQVLAFASLMPAVIGYVIWGPIGGLVGLLLLLAPIVTGVRYGWLQPPKKRPPTTTPPDRLGRGET